MAATAWPETVAPLPANRRPGSGNLSALSISAAPSAAKITCTDDSLKQFAVNLQNREASMIPLGTHQIRAATSYGLFTAVQEESNLNPGQSRTIEGLGIDCSKVPVGASYALGFDVHGSTALLPQECRNLPGGVQSCSYPERPDGTLDYPAATQFALEVERPAASGLVEAADVPEPSMTLNISATPSVTSITCTDDSLRNFTVTLANHSSSVIPWQGHNLGTAAVDDYRLFRAFNAESGQYLTSSFGLVNLNPGSSVTRDGFQIDCSRLRPGQSVQLRLRATASTLVTPEQCAGFPGGAQFCVDSRRPGGQLDFLSSVNFDLSVRRPDTNGNAAPAPQADPSLTLAISATPSVTSITCNGDEMRSFSATLTNSGTSLIPWQGHNLGASSNRELFSAYNAESGQYLSSSFGLVNLQPGQSRIISGLRIDCSKVALGQSLNLQFLVGASTLVEPSECLNFVGGNRFCSNQGRPGGFLDFNATTSFTVRVRK